MGQTVSSSFSSWLPATSIKITSYLISIFFRFLLIWRLQEIRIMRKKIIPYLWIYWKLWRKLKIIYLSRYFAAFRMNSIPSWITIRWVSVSSKPNQDFAISLVIGKMSTLVMFIWTKNIWKLIFHRKRFARCNVVDKLIFFVKKFKTCQ